MDIDDYINSLVKDNENLKNTVESLKKEIAILREERRIILNNNKGPNSITWKENNNND
jgi:cell division protein FtsB